MRWKIAALIPALVLATIPAHGAIDVTPSVVILEPGSNPETIITVTNAGDKLAYVTVEPREVMARGETDEKLRIDPNPATLGILVTPARMVLEHGERRGVRIVTINPPGPQDRVWRIKTAPVAGKIKSGQSGIGFLIAYDVLFIQRASSARVAVTGTRNGKKLTLTNAGNSFAMISAIKHCPAAGPCAKLPDTKRLYGGQSWSLDLPVEGGALEVTVDGVNGKAELLKL